MHRELVHTIGNLTLTGYNTELSNSPFQRKQDLLQRSNLELNKPIAATARWGRPEILSRADDLAARAAHVWPEPLSGVRAADGRDWTLLEQALAELPSGAWTTYGDLAVLIGSHAVPVGVRLSTVPIRNGHRVLTAEGRASPQFHWIDPADTRNVTEVLTTEGVTFDAAGMADRNQCLNAAELASLLGMDVSDADAAMASSLQEVEARHGRFLSQTGERHGPRIVGVIQRLLQDWTSMGCSLDFGAGSETSCFLLLQTKTRAPWPFTLYPYGSVEIVFQYLRTRPPFDDLTLRDEFRCLLNAQPGIEIARAKLELRPSFPMTVLLDPVAYHGVVKALEWFVEIVQKAGPSAVVGGARVPIP